jgi:hypothetical protein
VSPKNSKRSRKNGASAIHAESFLKSINLVFDADQPSRIEHFRPTTKCVSLIRAMTAQEDDRAFLIVAPYGTGKSLTAVYTLQLIENRPDASVVLRDIAGRLKSVSKELGGFAENRAKHADRQGIVIALHGTCECLAAAVRDAAAESIQRLSDGRQSRFLQSMPAKTGQDAIAILNALKEKATEKGYDRIVIIWDEFGRHLESLVADGRGEALLELQLLAEFVSRSSDIPITLGLILHQGLLHYASNAPQGVRSDWKKIEGRFRTIQYVDDSKEIYRLVGEVMADRRGEKEPDISKRKATDLAKAAQESGLFTDFAQCELSELLHAAFPLEPATLYLLPRVSARVAQNERTLFSFLYHESLTYSISPQHLYDYFSPAMRADTAVGGTHRQWLETESALSKVPDDASQMCVLKTACLLGLGTSGERSRTGRALLEFSAMGYDKAAQWSDAIQSLIERKLLLHRRHNDDVSIWHGTDMDLRGKLEDEKRAIAPGFDLLQFLNREAPPPAWKPVEYNDRKFIRRYLLGEYQTVTQFDSFVNFQMLIEQLPPDSDGKVIYLIADSHEQLESAIVIAKEHLSDSRIVVALPSEPLPLQDAAIEVAALQRMQLNVDLVESDPLALPELQQMTDDARNHLQKLVDRLLRPGRTGPRWFYQGTELTISSPRALRSNLSAIMENVFSSTPIINNEMIVRKKPTPTLINSRKKLLLGLLERHGQEDFGIQGHFPDKSMFRTVLLQTGLYRQNLKTDAWEYAAPSAIKGNPGLKAVWTSIQKFMTEPSEKPKQIRPFFEKLLRPPIGLRAGLIPILFAAGLKAFANAVSITKNGDYLNDLLPTDIEDLCRNPDDYQLTVLELDDKRERYLRKFHQHFSTVTTYEVPHNDLIRQCFDAIQGWKSQIPPAALTTRRLSPMAIKFRDGIARITDPVRLLMKYIPDACECDVAQNNKLMAHIKKCAEELESIAAVYGEQASASIRNAIGLGRTAATERVIDVCQRWAACFSDGFIEKLSDGVAKALLSRMRMPYETDAGLLDSLGSLLVGKTVGRWDDSTVATFDREFHNVVRRIEDTSLSGGEKADAGGISELIHGRMVELFDRLVGLVGKSEAHSIIDSIAIGHGKGSLWHKSAK